MPRIGDHPIAGPLLAAAFERSRQMLCALALRYGVRQQDVDDVIQEAYLAVVRLNLIGELLERLDALGDSPPDAAAVRDALTALLVVYLKYACRDHFRKLRRDGNIPGCPATPLDGAIGELLTDLFPDGEANPQAVLSGDEGAFEHLCDLICDRAGLTPTERAWARFTAHNPDAHQKEFAPSLPACTITRNKQAAMKKICHFVMTGQAIGQTVRG